MSLINELFLRYGVKSDTELYLKKTDSKEIQHKGMPGGIGVPTLVKLTADKCKELCDESGLEYLPGYENRVIERIVTTEAPDRDGDIVRAKGIDNRSYRKNPVILFAHNKGSIPIGNSIKEWMEKSISGWKSWDLFLDNSVDTTGWSDLIFRFVKSGAMPGASIGFIPVEAKHDHSPEERSKIGLGKWGVEYLKIEKLEHSACAVPSNQEALIAHLKSVDISMALKNINKNDFDIMSKSDMVNDDIIDIFKTKLFSGEKTFSLPELTIPKDKNIENEDDDGESIEEKDVTKPYPNEHAARIKDPSEFKEDSFKNKKIEDGIRIIIGKLKDGGETMVTQAYRFDVKKFTAEEAKIWLKDHKIKYIKFEAATGKEVNQPIINMNISMDNISVEISNITKKIEDLNKSVERFEKSLIEKCDSLMTTIEKSMSAIEQKNTQISLYDRSEIENIFKM
jgi:hypothetical protein